MALKLLFNLQKEIINSQCWQSIVVSVVELLMLWFIVGPGINVGELLCESAKSDYYYI